MSRAPVVRIHQDELVIDSFAGGGGTSVGIEWALGRSPDIAVNHDARAIAMHQANHPATRHLISNVFDVDWVAECAGRPVALFWLSPDCTYHSVARGGKPFRERNKALRIRGLANIAPRVAKLVRPRCIILENVREFEDWGPLLPNGKPCPERAGLNFRRFVKQLENVGYKVEWRDLVACDYGAPTSRTRLFLVARCDGQPIVWPEPTHGPGRPLPWRTAAECIDWSIPCPSIFERDRQLAANTERRIARGVWKFVINDPNPFLVPVMHGDEARAWSIDEPMRTITTAHRGDRALVVPYLAGVGGRKGQSPETTLERPYHTVTAKADTALIAPTLIQTGYGEREGQAPRCLDLGAPMGTLVGTNKQALVAALLTKHYGGHETPGSRVGAPFDTITSRDHHALTTSHLVSLKGSTDAGVRAGQRVDRPMPVVQAHGMHIGEVRAFLIRYYSEGGQWGDLKAPLSTITTRDRVGLVTVHGEDWLIADIGMRMLVPRELYRGQGFPDSYIITPLVQSRRTQKPVFVPLSQEGQVEMCGNSVPPYMAKAMVLAQFAEQREEIAA